MSYKNNVGPQVRRRRYALGWSQSGFAAKLQIAGFDISRPYHFKPFTPHDEKRLRAAFEAAGRAHLLDL